MPARPYHPRDTVTVNGQSCTVARMASSDTVTVRYPGSPPRFRTVPIDTVTLVRHASDQTPVALPLFTPKEG